MIVLRGMPFAIAAVVGFVAWGVGGYAPWAMLVLELSAVCLAGWIVVSVVFRTTSEARARNVAIARSRRRLFGRGARVDVEILAPGDDGESPTPTTRGTPTFYFLGYPFRRTGVGLLALGATLWMGLSLVPLGTSWLSAASPVATSLRHDVDALLGRDAISSAPWSVTPFLSYQDVLLWLAYLTLFWATFQIARSSTAVRRLSAALFVVGIASGAYGLVQWLTIVGASVGEGAPAGGLMATGTFGNRNHYAYFQEMMLLLALGWLLAHSGSASRSRDRASSQEAKARSALVAVGVAAIGLSLVFSLSRSGIVFAVAGVAFLLVLRRRDADRSAKPVLAALALCLVAAVLWIGIDPILNRFELVPRELTIDENGRVAVWRDSLAAVEDFWLTGSGLSSFQYVYPMYRSFGGRRFYSWAHNDYLQIAIELGLPGLILTLLIIIWIVRRARRVRSRLADLPALKDLHAGYCAGTLAVGLHSFTDFGLHLPANAALLAVLIGVVTGLAPSHHTGRRKTKRRKKKLRRSPPVPA